MVESQRGEIWRSSDEFRQIAMQNRRFRNYGNYNGYEKSKMRIAMS
jgi:hypothetical protein